MVYRKRPSQKIHLLISRPKRPRATAELLKAKQDSMEEVISAVKIFRV